MVTRLSSKGQIVLPRPVRDAHRWAPGTVFTVEDMADGVLLRPAKPFPPTQIDDVFGCANYHGPAKTLEEMDAAVMAEAKRHIR